MRAAGSRARIPEASSSSSTSSRRRDSNAVRLAARGHPDQVARHLPARHAWPVLRVWRAHGLPLRGVHAAGCGGHLPRPGNVDADATRDHHGPGASDVGCRVRQAGDSHSRSQSPHPGPPRARADVRHDRCCLVPRGRRSVPGATLAFGLITVLFAAPWLDFAGMWLTKFASARFAIVTLAGGWAMGLGYLVVAALAVQQMWVSRERR